MTKLDKAEKDINKVNEEIEQLHDTIDNKEEVIDTLKKSLDDSDEDTSETEDTTEETDAKVNIKVCTRCRKIYDIRKKNAWVWDPYFLIRYTLLDGART